MNYIHGHPHSKEAEFYELLLDYDESLEKDLADCRVIWYESGTHNLMVGDYGMPDRIISMVISKKFGFISWLVYNDKIDRDKVLISFTMSESDGLGNYYGHGVEGYQRILMLLAIQDEPIEFLISILK